MKNLILILLSVLLSGITTAQQFPVKKLNGIPTVRVVPDGVNVKAAGTNRISLPYARQDGNLYYMDNATEKRLVGGQDEADQWVPLTAYAQNTIVAAFNAAGQPRLWSANNNRPNTITTWDATERANWTDTGEVPLNKFAAHARVSVSDPVNRSNFDLYAKDFNVPHFFSASGTAGAVDYIEIELNASPGNFWIDLSDGTSSERTATKVWQVKSGETVLMSKKLFGSGVEEVRFERLEAGGIDPADIQTTIRDVGTAEDTKIPSELAIRTELDLKMAVADLVTVIRATGTAEDTKYPTEKSVRDALDALDFAGDYQGSAATFAALPASPTNGDWAILTAEDGVNQPGIYITNGTNYSLAKEIPDIIVLSDADIQDIASTVTGTVSGNRLYDREQALQSTLPNFQPTDADNAIAKSHSPLILTQWAESARAFHDAANSIFDANSLLLTNPARLISIDPSANTLSNMPESHTEGIRAFITVQGNGVNGGPSTAGQAFMFVTEHNSPTAIGIFHRTLTGSTWSTWTRQTEDMWIETDANVGTLAVPLGNKVVLADGKDISLTVLVSTKVEPVRVVPRTDWGNCNQIQVSDAGWSIQPQPTKGTQELLYIPNHTTQTWEAKEVDNEFVKSGTTDEKVALGIVPSNTGFFDTDLKKLQYYNTSTDVFQVVYGTAHQPFAINWPSNSTSGSGINFKVTEDPDETVGVPSINLPDGTEKQIWIVAQQVSGNTVLIGGSGTLGGTAIVRNDGGIISLVSIPNESRWNNTGSWATLSYNQLPNLVAAQIDISDTEIQRIFSNVLGAGTWANTDGTTQEGLIPDWQENKAYAIGDKVVAPMPVNADFISNDGALVNVNYIFEAKAIRPNTITDFDDVEADGGFWDLVGVFKVNGTDDRVFNTGGNFALDPLNSLSNTDVSEYIKWKVVDVDMQATLLPAPAFITLWKDYTGKGIAQPTTANETFTIPANVTMEVHRVGNAVKITFESNSAEEDIVITQQVIGTALVEERGIFKEIHDDVVGGTTGVVTFPNGGFSSAPKVLATAETNGHTINIKNVTATSFTYDQWDVEDVQQGGNFTYYAKGLK